MFSFCFASFVLHLLPSGIDFRSLCFCVFFFCIWRVQGTPRVAVGFSSCGPHVVAVDFQGDRIRFNRSSSDRHTSNTGVQPGASFHRTAAVTALIRDGDEFRLSISMARRPWGQECVRVPG